MEQHIYASDHKEDNETFMDYVKKLAKLNEDGDHIDHCEFHRLDGYNGYWVIIVTGK